MENEHRQTSRDSNPGLIERDLVGSQISNRTQTAQPRRQSNPTLQNNSHGQSATANNIATQPKPVQSNGIPKSKSVTITYRLDEIFMKVKGWLLIVFQVNRPQT